MVDGKHKLKFKNNVYNLRYNFKDFINKKDLLLKMYFVSIFLKLINVHQSKRILFTRKTKKVSSVA